MAVVTIYVPAWFGLVFLAIANGALREKVYGSRMKELTAHQVSTLIGLVLFAGYMWGITKLRPLASVGQALGVGGIWLVMTIVFEFIFGHYVMGHTWRHLLQDYNLLKGRLWVLVLGWTAAGPYILYRFMS